MKTSKPHPKLKKLKDRIGGTIPDGEELYHGTGKRQIFIHVEENKEGFWFWLWSQRPLYKIRNGRPYLVKQRIAGDSKGWYAAKVAEDDVDTAIQFAMSQSEPGFAYESVLHDYCLHHLDEIEEGLSLCVDGGISGAEIPAGGRSIDILAVDAAMSYVVLETKRAAVKRQTIDQLLDYMGWVRDHVAKPGQRVRGIIIARQISKDLQRAASVVPDVELIEYDFSIRFKRVARPGA